MTEGVFNIRTKRRVDLDDDHTEFDMNMDESS